MIEKCALDSETTEQDIHEVITHIRNGKSSCVDEMFITMPHELS